jgi:hypothetical protein
MTRGMKAHSAAVGEGGGYNLERNCGQPFRGASGTKHGKSNQWFSFHASSIVIFIKPDNTNIAQKTMSNKFSRTNFW